MNTISEIIDMVQKLLNGIKANTLIDPVIHANKYQEAIEELGGDFHHKDGLGYVMMDGEDVVLVHWVEDGVHFDEHSFHEDMVDIIKAAAVVIRSLEGQVDEDDDDTDDDMEWI